MKGIVFNLLEQVVVEEYGESTWDNLLEATGLSGVYTAVGSYEDDELLKLVGVASETLGQKPDDLVRWFGRSAIPLLYERYPSFFSQHEGTRSFLLTLNEVIHPEVRKLFPGAYAPSFIFDESRPDGLGLRYQSHRNLCSFAEGLIEGAADHYGDRVAIDQRSCTKRGDAECDLEVTIRKG
jgi:hypothetical protein